MERDVYHGPTHAFIVDYPAAERPVPQYGISRPTGDKWIDRYRIHQGLDDLSRRPGCHPDTTAPEIGNRDEAGEGLLA